MTAERGNCHGGPPATCGAGPLVALDRGGRRRINSQRTVKGGRLDAGNSDLAWSRGPGWRFRGRAVVLILGGLPFAAQGSNGAVTPQGSGTRVDTLAAVLELSVPDSHDRPALGRIAGVVSLAGGGMAVLSADDRAIMVFDSAGQLRRSFGRAGGGPGEFRIPRGLGRLRDTLWTWDLSLARITTFTVDGRLIATLPVPVAGRGVLLRDGAVGVLPHRGFSGTTASRPDTLLVWRVVGSERRQVLRKAFTHRVLSVPTGGNNLVGAQPFDDGPLVAAANDGSGFVIIDRPSSATGRSTTFRVTRIGPAGDTVLARSVPYIPVPVTDGDLARAADRIVAPLPPAVGRQIRADVMARLYRPRYHPPVTGVLVARDGAIWLRREHREGSPTQPWLLLGTSGAPRAVVRLDSEVEPLDANADRVWGLQGSPDLGWAAVQLRLVRGR